jgi:hypothetical protein
MAAGLIKRMRHADGTNRRFGKESFQMENRITE